ncbi:MAG TPA: hypothetical protein VF232_01435 [Gaiellaceae bacterium]
MPKAHEPARIHVGITPAGAQHFKERLLNESSGFREQLEDTKTTQRLFAEYGINVPQQLIVNGVTMPTQEELERICIDEPAFESGSVVFFLHPIIFIIFVIAAKSEDY